MSGAVEVILDASGSMLQRLEGERRIEIAKAAVEHLLGDVLPAGAPFALRVFGHREADSCRTDLEIALAPLEVAMARSKVRGVEAKNRAKTPIGASLLAAKDDLAGVEGPATVVLVTDGEETCEGDPPAAISLALARIYARLGRKPEGRPWIERARRDAPREARFDFELRRIERLYRR